MRTRLYLTLFVVSLAFTASYAQTGRFKEPIMVPVEGGTFMMGSNTIDNECIWPY